PRILAFPSAVRSQRYSAIHERDWSLMKLLLQLAAAVQLFILIASASTPRVLDWRKNLAVLTFRHADAMAAREPVARSLCLFIAIFGGARLLVQFAIFDARPFLTNWFYKTGFHALTIIFAFLTFVYGKAAL
ncbi:MAG: hypothetical protein WCB20_03280, partial [Chthoniobacterales bacterium]